MEAKLNGQIFSKYYCSNNDPTDSVARGMNCPSVHLSQTSNWSQKRTRFGKYITFSTVESKIINTNENASEFFVIVKMIETMYINSFGKWRFK
jgi:hypothetical protein